MAESPLFITQLITLTDTAIISAIDRTYQPFVQAVAPTFSIMATLSTVGTNE